MSRSYVTEGHLVGAIWRALTREYPGIWVFKVVGGPYQMAGVPDLLLCVEGLLVGMEVKNPHPGESSTHARERATPQQRNVIGQINRAGGIAAVVVTVEEALDLVGRAKVKQEHLRGRRG